jgi:hypothetical protein
MKYLTAILLFSLAVGMLVSCKSTRDASVDKEPAVPTQVTPAQPSQEDFEYYTRQPKRGTLDPADAEVVINYAKEKANLVCKIQALEKQGSQNPELAEENKRKIISLEQTINAIDKKNEAFMDSDVKWHYYNKVYEKEMEKCKN